VEDGKTGVVFTEYSGTALLGALERAIRLFADRRKWVAMQRAGMRRDHSWDRSAQEYVRIYERVGGGGDRKARRRDGS
jgi:starch synthase